MGSQWRLLGTAIFERIQCCRQLARFRHITSCSLTFMWIEMAACVGSSKKLMVGSLQSVAEVGFLVDTQLCGMLDGIADERNCWWAPRIIPANWSMPHQTKLLYLKKKKLWGYCKCNWVCLPKYEGAWRYCKCSYHFASCIDVSCLCLALLQTNMLTTYGLLMLKIKVPVILPVLYWFRRGFCSHVHLVIYFLSLKTDCEGVDFTRGPWHINSVLALKIAVVDWFCPLFILIFNDHRFSFDVRYCVALYAYCLLTLVLAQSLSQADMHHHFYICVLYSVYLHT